MSGRFDLLNVQSEIQRAAERYHDAVSRGWTIADDSERERTVSAVHDEVTAELRRIQARFQVDLQRERLRLRWFAFTPSAGAPADRSAFERIAAEVDASIADEHAARRLLDRAHTDRNPLLVLAILQTAYRHRWTDLLRDHRARTDDPHGAFPSALGRLLDFDAAVAASGLERTEAFDLRAVRVRAGALN